MAETFVYATYIRTTPEKLSRVTYELTPMGDQVRLRLIHENLLPEDKLPRDSSVTRRERSLALSSDGSAGSNWRMAERA